MELLRSAVAIVAFLYVSLANEGRRSVPSFVVVCSDCRNAKVITTVPVGVANGFDGLVSYIPQFPKQGPGLLATAPAVDHEYGMGKFDHKHVPWALRR